MALVLDAPRGGETVETVETVVTVESRYPNGQLRTRASYDKDGWYHGEYRTWREDGRPYELRHYTNGQEDGRQQSWDENGALYLNYEVRQGRRYGFVNAYPCAPGTGSRAGGQVAPTPQGDRS